jgi:RecB family exonuclease
MTLLLTTPKIVLPVDHLSASSISTYLKCPETWRRRYIDDQRTPATTNMALGTTLHKLIERHNQALINNEAPPTFEAQSIWANLDLESRLNEAGPGAEWPEQQTTTEAATQILQGYETYANQILQGYTPTSVERRITLELPNQAWTLTGYIDIEGIDNETGETIIADIKLRSRRMPENTLKPDHEAHQSIQAGIYLLARHSEGNPVDRFEYHQVHRKSGECRIIETQRTEQQLRALTRRILTIAKEIEWRVQTDTWSGASPDHFGCGTTCPHWDTCSIVGNAE